MDPIIETTMEDGRHWLRISGWMSMRMGPALTTYLTALADGGATAVWIDLQQCEHIDSTIMGCLVGFVQRRTATGGPRLVINRSSEPCMAALRQMRLDTFLTLDDAQPPESGWQVLDAENPTSAALADAVVAAHQDLAAQNPDDPSLARLAQSFASSNAKRQQS